MMPSLDLASTPDPGALLARLVRVYGLSPQELLSIPIWQLRILIQHIATNEAVDLSDRITASMTPHMRTDDRRQLLRQLDTLKDPLYPRKPTLRIRAQGEPDAQKAAEWFKALGIKTDARI